MDQVDRVIEFLERCGDVDIESGVAALIALGTESRIQQFKAGLKAAIAGTPELTIEARTEGVGGGIATDENPQE